MDAENCAILYEESRQLTMKLVDQQEAAKGSAQVVADAHTNLTVARGLVRTAELVDKDNQDQLMLTKAKLAQLKIKILEVEKNLSEEDKNNFRRQAMRDVNDGYDMGSLPQSLHRSRFHHKLSVIGKNLEKKQAVENFFVDVDFEDILNQ